MRFGAITNSWRPNLAEEDLASLVAKAEARGARHIELRQSYLGNCEIGEGEEWLPEYSNLQELVASFPNLSFNLAIAWPCLTKSSDPTSAQFQAVLKAATVIDSKAPHIRLVDTASFDHAWESAAQIPEEAMGVAALAREAAFHEINLSIENSGQPIRSLHLLLKRVRERLTDKEATYLGLCPDPANQLRNYPGSDPLQELEELSLGVLKIVHFKQSRNGEPHPTVDTGDLDCARMVQILQAKKFRGPAIMEIPPHERIFDNLSASFSFIEAAIRRS